MKVVILAGGFGTRISEESILKPKPMIEIGNKPILWHIMKIYASYGFNDFIICAGYKDTVIKQWFLNYKYLQNDLYLDFASAHETKLLSNNVEDWKITIINTGLTTMTGGRIKRIEKYTDHEPFLLTYGDGVSDVNINELVKFHNTHGKIATLTAVKPLGRFGGLDIKDDKIVNFREKKQEDVNWINGGFMVLQPEIFDYIDGDACVFEQYPLETLAQNGQLSCYKHTGFWACMDTLNDKNRLTKLWDNNTAPWKVW